MWVSTPLTLLLWAVLFMFCAESHMWDFYFVNERLTWSEAQQFCRKHYHDLATVRSAEDNLRLPRPPGYTDSVWIGLHDNAKDLSQWKWTATGSRGFFAAWLTQEPDYVHDGLQCGSLYTTGGWAVFSCSLKKRALCYSGSNPKVFHYTNDEMTWINAVKYCRTHYTDLALIENAEENTAALSGSTSHYVWIGMIRSPWRWSDKSSVSYTNWTSLNGNRYHGSYCAAENVHQTWDFYSCTQQRTFYCQKQEKPTRSFVKIKFSGQSLDDPVIKQQISEQIQKKFQEAGHTKVNIMWKTAPEKQAEYKEKPNEQCNV